MFAVAFWDGDFESDRAADVAERSQKSAAECFADFIGGKVLIREWYSAKIVRFTARFLNTHSQKLTACQPIFLGHP
jgi:hypothetical protein